eukprot:scaffold4263_cov124-Skeletonema_marinoi.AAC.1
MEENEMQTASKYKLNKGVQHFEALEGWDLDGGNAQDRSDHGRTQTQKTNIDGDFISRSKIAQPGIFHVASITERHATLRLRSNHRSKYLIILTSSCHACPRSALSCHVPSPQSTSSCSDPQ